MKALFRYIKARHARLPVTEYHDRRNTDMSSKNEQIVRRFMIEHFKNSTIHYEMCTGDFVVHWAWGKSTSPASEVVRILSPPSDPHLEIDDCFASGNKVGM